MKFITVFNFFIGMSIGRPLTSMEEALELLKVSTESQLNYMKSQERELEALDERLDENFRRVQQELEKSTRLQEKFEEKRKLREQKRQQKRQRKRQRKMDSMSEFDD